MVHLQDIKEINDDKTFIKLIITFVKAEKKTGIRNSLINSHSLIYQNGHEGRSHILLHPREPSGNQAIKLLLHDRARPNLKLP